MRNFKPHCCRALQAQLTGVAAERLFSVAATDLKADADAAGRVQSAVDRILDKDCCLRCAVDLVVARHQTAASSALRSVMQSAAMGSHSQAPRLWRSRKALRDTHCFGKHVQTAGSTDASTDVVHAQRQGGGPVAGLLHQHAVA